MKYTAFILLILVLASRAIFGGGLFRNPAFVSSINSAQSQSTNSTPPPSGASPDSLSNIVYWVDVYSNLKNGSGSAPSEGDEVYYWGDKSTNAFYFTNYSGVGLNYHTSGGPTNGPRLSTDSTSSAYLSLSDGRAWSQPNTMFIVVNQSRDVSEYYLTGTNSSIKNGLLTTAGMTLRASGGASLTAPNVITGSADWWIISVQFNGASSFIKTNGVLNVSGDAGANAASRPVIGNPSGNGLDGVAEVVMYNRALTSNEVRSVEQYLGSKHGKTIP